MSLFIDHKYIAQISCRLEKFKRKNQRTYNFRCPLCGDSAKSKIKARGFFCARGSNMGYYCHNCLRSWTFAHFLQEFDPPLYEQYIFERYTSGENGHSNYEKPTFSEFNFKTEFKPKEHIDTELCNLPTLESLPDSHYARQYVVGRKIPEQFYSDLYLCSDFKKLIDQFEPDNEYVLKENDTRIVIPFRDTQKRIIAIQGRSFEKKGLRYITIKVDKDAPKIYGLDRANPDDRVYVVEGPIDSMFLPNSLATAGSNLGTKDLSMFNDVVFIFDNERRSPAIIAAMKKLADNDKKVCVWPEHVVEKDINDMILAGRTSQQIVDIINQNVHKGLAVRIAINEWSKC